MYTGVNIGFLANLQVLEEELKRMCRAGNRCWIANDLEEIAAQGYVCVGYGTRGCYDRLNRAIYRFPILSQNFSWHAPRDFVIGIEPNLAERSLATSLAGQGMDAKACEEEFHEFYSLLQSALQARLASML